MCLLVLASAAQAQEDAAAAQLGRGAPQSSVSSRAAKGSHPFWDKDNVVPSTGVGARRARDYVSMRHSRDRGIDEWLLTNNMVDNEPLFAGLEAAGGAASIGASYLFHRSGHHKLERWLSPAHIGAGVRDSAWNYTLPRNPP